MQLAKFYYKCVIWSPACTFYFLFLLTINPGYGLYTVSVYRMINLCIYIDIHMLCIQYIHVYLYIQCSCIYIYIYASWCLLKTIFSQKGVAMWLNQEILICACSSSLQ